MISDLIGERQREMGDRRREGHVEDGGRGNSLVVPSLEPRASTAGGTDLIPGQETKIP